MRVNSVSYSIAKVMPNPKIVTPSYTLLLKKMVQTIACLSTYLTDVLPQFIQYISLQVTIYQAVEYHAHNYL